jgi:hypothetical protein
MHIDFGYFVGYGLNEPVIMMLVLSLHPCSIMLEIDACLPYVLHNAIAPNALLVEHSFLILLVEHSFLILIPSFNIMYFLLVFFLCKWDIPCNLTSHEILFLTFNKNCIFLLHCLCYGFSFLLNDLVQLLWIFRAHANACRKWWSCICFICLQRP